MSFCTVDIVLSLIADVHKSTECDIEKLNELFSQLECLLQNESNSIKSICIRELCVPIKSVLTHLINLRAAKHNSPAVVIEVNIQHCLTKLLRYSFDEDYRKAELSFGLADILVELLTQIVAVNSVIDERLGKELSPIANCLTNLTYLNVTVKRRICLNPIFMECVSKVIHSVPGMLQAYGALIRNLSWNSDTRMIEALTPTVPILAISTVRCHQRLIKGSSNVRSEEKCLLAGLSALWNLASHSVENKKQMCETPGFLSMLIAEMTTDPSKTAFAENSSGIMKYLSAYISMEPLLLKSIHEAKIIPHLLNLLSSSSFTVILNSLGSLGSLVTKDDSSVMKLLNNEVGRNVLESLLNSAREDVRNAAKIVITHLNSSPWAGHYLSQPMATSCHSRSPCRALMKKSSVGKLHDNVSEPTTSSHPNRSLLPQRNCQINADRCSNSHYSMSDSDNGTKNETQFLSDAINSVMPKPKNKEKYDEGNILDECIARVLPKPRLFLSSTDFDEDDDIVENSTILVSRNTSEAVFDANRVENRKCMDPGDYVNTIPSDVNVEWEADQVVIDCDTIRKPNRLSRTAARISPFNYTAPSIQRNIQNDNPSQKDII